MKFHLSNLSAVLLAPVLMSTGNRSADATLFGGRMLAGAPLVLQAH